MSKFAKLVSVGVAASVLVGTVRAEECPISAALKKLPKLTYKVAGEETCCAKAAAQLAKKNEAEIQFVLAEKTFDKESDAKLALVEATEAFVKEYSTPCKCEVSGTTTVAGKSTQCDVAAGKLAALVETAVKDIKLTYQVGDKSCDCPFEAKSLAAQSKDKVVLCVGKDKTECEITGRLNLARAKYKAIVEALVAAEKEAEKKNSET